MDNYIDKSVSPGSLKNIDIFLYTCRILGLFSSNTDSYAYHIAAKRYNDHRNKQNADEFLNVVPMGK